MDVLTVIASASVSALTTVVLMFGFYKLWILPYLTKLTESVPSQCRSLLEPFVDEKLEEVSAIIDDRMESIVKTVRTSSARFQRTVNQAAQALDLEMVDLSTEEGQELATQQLSKRYGMDVAVQAVSQLVQSIISAKKEAEKPAKGDLVW